MIVLDASAVVEWLLNLRLADAVEEHMLQTETMHVPHLLSVEVAQVMRRYATAGDITEERGTQALTDLADLDVIRHAHEPLLPSVWRLRANLTAYDAVYVALALALDAALITLDSRLANAPVPGTTIELLG